MYAKTLKKFSPTGGGGVRRCVWTLGAPILVYLSPTGAQRATIFPSSRVPSFDVKKARATNEPSLLGSVSLMKTARMREVSPGSSIPECVVAPGGGLSWATASRRFAHVCFCAEAWGMPLRAAAASPQFEPGRRRSRLPPFSGFFFKSPSSSSRSPYFFVFFFRFTEVRPGWL